MRLKHPVIVSLQKTTVYICQARSLRGTCRLCYRGLAYGAGLLLRMLPQIRAAYLAGSMATGDPEPGLSDIDFVLVVADLPWDQEYRLVRRIEAILRYTIPPWGRSKVGLHVLIYAQREWVLVADIFLGKRYGKPRTVFDKDHAKAAYTMEDSIKGLHHLYKALWRLESLQNALWKGPKSEIEHLLCARMADRIRHSIHNAVCENFRRETGVPAGQSPESVDEHAPIPTYPGSESSPDVLPGLLQALDEATSTYAPRGPCRLLPGIAGGMELDEVRDHGIAGTAALVANAVEGIVAWVARAGAIDIVVLDSTACEASADIFHHLTGAGDRQPLVVTRTVFERLYLNGPVPFRFCIGIPEEKICSVAGAYTSDRALIDAYAVYSKMRAVAESDDHEQYRSMLTTLENLTAYFASRTDSSTLHRGCQEMESSGTEPEEPHDSRRAFQHLHALGARLARTLSSHLDSQVRPL